MNYSLVVPTLNGGASWKRAAAAIACQQPKPQRILIIDSCSVDGTVEIAREHGFDVLSVKQADFDHGGTRQSGVNQLAETEIVVFLTQDAILLGDDSIVQLLESFNDPKVGAAYGRQISGSDASLFEQHARAYNYPNESIVKTKSSIPRMGIKAAFCSNSFAAYRISTLQEVGGFPDQTLFAEDMLVAAKMILAGYSIAYEAGAQCEHWHDYSISQEFRRAFDIGVFHHRESWILEEFGGAEGEGGSLILTGLRKIAAENFLELPVALMKYLVKVAGYGAGRAEHLLPTGLKRKLSMNRAFWNSDD
jgi:rhamnosyltransferase